MQWRTYGPNARHAYHNYVYTNPVLIHVLRIERYWLMMKPRVL